MRDLFALREQVATWDGLSRDVEDALALLDLAEEAGDDETAAEAGEQAATLQKRYESLEFQLAMSGPYDRNGAILSIHAGAGGTEARTGQPCCCACI